MPRFPSIRTPAAGARSLAILISLSIASPAPAEVGPPAEPAPGLSPPAAPIAREHRPIGPSRSAAESPEPDNASAPSAGNAWFLRTALSLGAVVGLIGGSAAVTRVLARGRGGLAGAMGAGGHAPSGVLSVLGRFPVCRGQKLVLLQLDRRVLLVSQSTGGRLGAGGGMATLCEITDPDEVASLLIKTRDAEGESMSEKFRSMLGGFERALRHQPELPPAAGMRRITASPSGDQVDVWDDRAIAAPETGGFPIKQPGPPEQDAVGSLRRRLAALRSEVPGGEADS